MKIKKTQIYKSRLKPTDCDLHLKYNCPQCRNDHWLSLLEASTKDFKIACDCGTVLKVKRVLGLKIKYAKNLNPTTNKKEKASTNTEDKNNSVINQSIGIIQSYGFTKEEAQDLVNKCYGHSKSYCVSDLVKKTLESMRIKNESLDETV